MGPQNVPIKPKEVTTELVPVTEVDKGIVSSVGGVANQGAMTANPFDFKNFRPPTFIDGLP